MKPCTCGHEAIAHRLLLEPARCLACAECPGYTPVPHEHAWSPGPVTRWVTVGASGISSAPARYEADTVMVLCPCGEFRFVRPGQTAPSVA